MSDSTTTTKDLSTGVHAFSAGRSPSLGKDGASSKPTSFFTFTDTLYNAHSDIPPPLHNGRVFSTTSNIWPTRHSMTSLLHPVPESTNQYSILTVYDANDDPTDTTPKQGIIVGPYTNEDLESDGALPTDDSHAEVALRPATRPAKHPASSSSRAKASNEKATTISPVTLTTETTSRWPFGCEPPMTHDRSGDTKPHARALQSSVAEGRANFEKGGPQARSGATCEEPPRRPRPNACSRTLLKTWHRALSE